MVRGLDVFREHFADHADQFVLIGGTAATLAMEEAAASLSAILLDDAYYEFILAGRREIDGLPWVGEDRLIPLKASAWLDLGQRQAKGEPIDTKSIRKHAIEADRSIDPKSLGINSSVVELVERIARAYGLSRPG